MKISRRLKTALNLHENAKQRLVGFDVVFVDEENEDDEDTKYMRGVHTRTTSKTP